MAEDKLNSLYKNISNDYDLPDYDQFKEDMSDPEKSSKLHETLINDNWDIPDYDQFKSDLGLKKKDDSEISSEVSASPEVEPTSTSASNELIKQAELEGQQRPPLTIQEQHDLERREVQKQPLLPETEMDEPIAEMSTWIGEAMDRREAFIEKQEAEFAKETVERVDELFNDVKIKQKEAEVELKQAKYTLAMSLADNRGLSEEVKNDPSLQNQLDAATEASEVAYEFVKDVEAKTVSLNNANEILTKAKKYYNTKDSGILDSMINSQYGKDFFTFGFNEMFRNVDILEVANKPKSERTEEETIALTSYALSDQLMGTNPQGVSSIIGSSVASTLPFLIEFYASGGASSTAKAGVKKALRELSEKQINKLTKKAIVKLTPTAVAATGAAATTPFLISEILPTVPKRMVGDVRLKEGEDGEVITIEDREDFSEAFGKTMATTYATAFIEGAGEGITKITQKAKKSFLTKTIPGKKISRVTEKVAERLPKIPGANNAMANMGKKAFNSVGIQSAIAEVSEEIIEAYAHPAITGDQKMSEVWDTKQMIGILGSVMIIGGARKGVDMAFRYSYQDRIDSRVQLNESASKLKPETILDIDRVSKGDNIETNASQLDMYIQKKNIEGATGDDIRNILDYYSNSLYVNSVDAAQAEVEQPITDKEKKEIKEAKLEEPTIEIKASTEVAKEKKVETPTTEQKPLKTEQITTKETTPPIDKTITDEKVQQDEIKTKDEGVSKEDAEEDYGIKEEVLKRPETKKEAISNITMLEGEKASLQESLKEVPEDQKSKLNQEIELIDNQLKEQETYAKEFESEPLRQESEAEKGEGIVDKDMPKIDRSVVQDGKKIQVEIDELSKIEKLDKKRSDALQSASDRISRLGNVSFAIDEKGKKQAIEDIAGLAVDLANAGIISLEIGSAKTAKIIRDYLEDKNSKAAQFIDENKADVEAAIEAQSKVFVDLSKAEAESVQPSESDISPIEKEDKVTEENFNTFPIGVTNSYTRASRIARGKDPITKEAKKSNQKLWDSVDEKIESGDIDPRAEVRRIYSEDMPHVTEERQAIILHDRIRITNEKKVINNDLAKAQEDLNTELEAGLYLRMAELENEQQINDIANTKLGATWGRTGQFRQRLAKDDYSLETIIREAKALNAGNNLTTAQEKKFVVLTEMLNRLQEENALLQDKIQKEQDQRDEFEKEERKRIEVELIDELKEKYIKEGREKSLRDAKSKAGDIKARGKKIANRIREAKLKNQDFTFATVVPPGIIDGAMEVVAKSIEVAAAAPAAAVDIASAINDGINYVKGTDWYKKLKTKDKLKFNSRFKEHAESIILTEDEATNSEEFDNLIEKLLVKADGVFHEGLDGILNKITYNRVKSGKTKVDEVVNDIYDAISDKIDVTKREIRDGVSGYGKFRKLSKDETTAAVAELKRQGRLDSSIEDVESGKLPLRTGQERRKKSDDTRRKESELARNIKERNLAPDLTAEEEADQWRSAEAAFERKLENEIADIEREIESGERKIRAKGKRVSNERIERLKEERDILKKQRDESFKLPPKTPEQKRKDVIIKSTKKAIAELTERIDKMSKGEIPEDEITAARKGGKDIFSFRKPKKEAIVDKEIDALKDLRSELQIELSNLIPEFLKDKALLVKYRNLRQKTLARLEEKQKAKDYGPKPKPTIPPLDKETTLINRKIRKVKEEIDKEKESIRLEGRDSIEKAKDASLEVWNLSKAMTASIDLSGPFRQGLIAIGKPKSFGRAFKEMFVHAFSKKRHENWLLDLKNDDVYYEMKDNKLYIAEPNAKLSAREEAYMSTWLGYLDKIPLYGPLRAGSERAYVGFLNKLRTDLYLDFRSKLKQEGFTGEELQNELKTYSHWINVSTGRGKLGPLESIAPIMNGLYFSPRLISARLALVNPRFWGKDMTGEAGKEARKTMYNFLSVATTILLLYDLMTEDDEERGVEWDPRSSDFLKIKDGNIRYDIMGGIQPVLRTGAQLLSGQTKTTTTGEIKRLEKKGFYGATKKDVAMRFFGNKLSPSAALVVGLANDYTTPMGEPMTLSNTVLSKVAPMYVMDMISIAKEEDPTKLAAAAPAALFGVGVQHYGTEIQDIQRVIDTKERAIKRAERNKRQAERAYRKTSDRKYREEKYIAEEEIAKYKSELREAQREKNRIK